MTLTAAEPAFDSNVACPSQRADERAYWVAWSQVDGVGPVLQKRLFLNFGSLSAAWAASADQLLAVDGIGLLLADQIDRVRSRLSPAQCLAQFEARSTSFWTPADADYPPLLFEIPDPPPVLYYRGNLRLTAAGLAVGIVGTRHPSDYGRRWTERLAQQLVQQGALIVSGMARGVDSIAHRCCVAAAAPTVAVLGTGVDVAYPSSNQTLHQQIQETGLLLSEYPDGTPPDRAHFPRRNRIIAGLSQAVLVTEAPERSGALITAHLANDYGREVYALPGSLDNPRSDTKLPAARGALPIEATHPPTAALPATALSTAASTTTAALPDPADLPPALRAAFDGLSTEPIGLDRLAQQTDLPSSELLSSLMQLELEGYVEQLPGMQYRRALP